MTHPNDFPFSENNDFDLGAFVILTVVMIILIVPPVILLLFF